MFNQKLFREHLIANIFCRNIQYYESLQSTNTKAWELVLQKAENGTIIITNNQLKGRGRQSNNWYSTPNKSLTFSIILYPKSKPEIVNLYSLIAGLAISDVLIKMEIPSQLKWPNDILINSKKVGGILCESKLSGALIKSLVIGIGLNVNNTDSDFPTEIQSTATSLLIQSGKDYQIEILLANILTHLENRINKKLEVNISDWQKCCAHLNKEVRFHSGNQIIKGIFTGLTLKGEAKMSINGEENIFSSGEIIG